MVTNIWSKIKLYVLGAWAVLTAAFVALFLYERNKAQVNEALVDEAKVNAVLTKQDDAITQNDAALKVEEQKRAALEKEVNTNASLNDMFKYFNSKPE